jgi:CHASE2 domain-containing sensor protein/signal transduction histidine kinase
MRQVRRRFLIEWMLMFLLLPSIIVWFDGKPGLADANAVFYDRILRDQPPSPSDDILIIGVDKRSLDALGSWPFPRSMHARLIDRLAAHAPRAVLFDVFFDGPAADPLEDQLLAEALSRLPVYLPLNYAAPPLEQPGRRPEFLPPTPALAAQAKGLGHANAMPDSDGLVRGIWRYEGAAGDRVWPYIGMVIAEDEAKSVHSVASDSKASGWVRQGRFGVAFAGPAGTYPTVPYVDALRGDVADEMLRGKLVLVGALGSSGLGDMRPVAGIGALTSLPGVEIHANALDALLNNRIIDVPTDWRRVLWISVPIWAVFILFLRSAGHAVAITFAMAMLCVTINYAALVRGQIGLPLASPLAGIVLAYLLWSWRRLSALLVFFRQRADALNAVPAGAFEPPLQAEPPALDSVERRTHALDRAIDRLTRLQSLLTEGVWQLPVAVLICRPDGVISQSNAAAQALLAPAAGQPPEGMRTLGATDPLWGVDLPRKLADMEKMDLPEPLSETPAGLWSKAMASEFTTRQGKVFRLRAASLGTSSEAAAAGWIVVLPDVTAERTAQREREQWFGFLSHDLRGPQVTILSLLALYAENAPDMNIRRLLDGVESEARRTIGLAEDFMDMVEAESGVYRFSTTFAGSVVLDAIDATWASAQARGVTLTPRLGVSDCTITADTSLLTRALVNLLNNAIRCSAKESTIFVCLEADGETEAVISVQDQGVGMDAGQIAQVMRAGDRRKSSASLFARDAGHGWGVGMAVVHAVVAHHGGWIDVISAPNAGTTFFIGLPLTMEVQGAS